MDENLKESGSISPPEIPEDKEAQQKSEDLPKPIEPLLTSDVVLDNIFDEDETGELGGSAEPIEPLPDSSPFQQLIEWYERAIAHVEGDQKEAARDDVRMLLNGPGKELEDALAKQISTADMKLAEANIRRKGLIEKLVARGEKGDRMHQLYSLRYILNEIIDRREKLLAALYRIFESDRSEVGAGIRALKLDVNSLRVIQERLREEASVIQETGERSGRFDDMMSAVEILQKDCSGIMGIQPEFFLRVEIFKTQNKEAAPGAPVIAVMKQFYNYCAALDNRLTMRIQNMKNQMLAEFLQMPQ